MLLKFCGLRRMQDIRYANEVGPDYVGFVFAESRRQVGVQQAAELAANLAPGIRTVGVFVQEPLETLCQTVEQVPLAVIQLHGDETRDMVERVRERFPDREVWKAVRVRDAQALAEADRLPVDALLLDSFVPGSYGGSGQTANWELIAQARLHKRFFLAGGLTAENIAQAAAVVHPHGIDVSGGIETQEEKDLAKMKAVKEAVCRAALEQPERKGDTHE